MDKIPRDIIYFVPQYLDSGDGVMLLLLNGEKKVCHMSIRSFTKKLYSMYAIDPLTIKKLISKKIGQKNLLPIVLPDVTFIPVKTRKAKVATDPIFGYVNLSQVFKIDEKKEGFEILFKCGAVLQCFGSAKYFKRRITAASIISDYFSSMWAKGVCTIKEECELENVFSLE
ncbi:MULTISPECIES: hypothetical protein [unclassified Caldicellulosiruptor]|uniref:hypothetical protein n=1 Tax=unclassified Caldicellulosiruptor TaxID=2622462 RepID=UPI0003A4AB3C|nr:MULTISPECIES: hypothetical protein [unclassified Caldicellulosiruptor]